MHISCHTLLLIFKLQQISSQPRYVIVNAMQNCIISTLSRLRPIGPIGLLSQFAFYELRYLAICSTTIA